LHREAPSLRFWRPVLRPRLVEVDVKAFPII
jgi:hypothetical protein